MPPPREARENRVLTDFTFTDVFHPHQNYQKKHAFTLAEVLITLGIIGVIAALTLPTLLANYQKKQIAVQLKKAYSVMSQAVKMSEIENGDADGWDYNLNAKTFYERYIQKYLSKTSELKFSEYKNTVTYKNMNGTNCSEAWCTTGASHYVMLSDGSVIGFSDHLGGNYKAFSVDINGYKKPNVTGKDYFIYTIQGKYGVTPYGYANTNGVGYGTTYDREVIKEGNFRSCNKNGTGVWCSGLILTDGWEIKDDYPW